MTTTSAPAWEAKRTAETCLVEETLRKAGFASSEAYRFNSASIRVRVVDPRFEGMRDVPRYDLVEPALDPLPERTQKDIISLYLFAPCELEPLSKGWRHLARNAEFDEAGPVLP